MKLFISQPMRYRTNEEILEEREAILKAVQEKYPDKKIEVVDSFFKDVPHEVNPLWFLSGSINRLSAANAAVFAKGWEQARGCRIEHQCAEEYGVKIIEY